MSIEVIRSGLNTTFQDRGRSNFYHLGIPFSGAMDTRNLLITNKLVGNDRNDAVIEFAMQGPKLKIKQNNINASYEKKLISENDIANIISKIKSEEIAGINVTVPFKNKIVPFVDILTKEADQTKSINTIYLEKGKTIGHNTDIAGFELGIRSYGYNIEKKNIPLELVFDNQRVGQVISDIDVKRDKGFLFQAYPTKNGIIHAKFHINEDDYILDNQWNIAIPILEEIRCAIVGNTLDDIEILKILLNSIDPNFNFISPK